MSLLRAHRELFVRAVWWLVDACIVALAMYAAAWVRFDFAVEPLTTRDFVWFAFLLAPLTHVVINLLFSLGRRRHPRGSFEETTQVGTSALLLAITLITFRALLPNLSVPRSLPFIGSALALSGMLAVRLVVRTYRWGASSHTDDTDAVVVYGAGDGGRQIVRALLSEKSRPRMEPVAVLDDDPRKQRWRIAGVKIRGRLDDLPSVVDETGAETLIIAMPSAPADRVREILEVASNLGLRVLTLPPVDQILGGIHGSDLRELDLEDLLGRRRVDLDLGSVSEIIRGRRILVTGAGGSIGSELCRQIARFEPGRLVMLDRDESALHAVQLSMTGRALLDDGTLALGDIRDPDALAEIFERERPEVVFHAAALKHLTLLELNPLEAWKTNVLGTLNVLEASRAGGVTTFVNVSTDKAARPTCILGYSKRIAERMTAAYADMTDGVYVSVRFGNVLGSRGSVIETFKAQIDKGGPLTVTHKDVERYFMLIPEAAQLVVQAAAIGRDGQAMVLDMGTPVRIADVAKSLIRLSGKRGIKIEFTGLRPGEKMTEDLFFDRDHVRGTAHRLISSVPVPRIDPRYVASLVHFSSTQARQWMCAAAVGPTNHSSDPQTDPRELGLVERSSLADLHSCANDLS